MSESLLADPRCSVQMQRSLTAIKDGGMRLARLVQDVVDSKGHTPRPVCPVCGINGCHVSEQEAAAQLEPAGARARSASLPSASPKAGESGVGLLVEEIATEAVRERVRIEEEAAQLTESNTRMREEVAELQERLEGMKEEIRVASSRPSFTFVVCVWS